MVRTMSRVRGLGCARSVNDVARPQADAVDSVPLGPLPSFLPPDANLVAQALWSDATLRALSAQDLARVLHVSSRDADDAIGALVGMMNRTARGNPNSSLTVDRSLSGAIGPFMSLDQAMSRFGSHVGPSVRSPTPSPLARVDAGPDRQYGAGRLGASHAFALESGPSRGDDDEAGAISQALSDATAQLLTFLQENGCSAAFAGVCGNFQVAYNNEYSPAIGVDDKYGSETQNALARVIADAGYEAAAPAACNYQVAPAAPSAPVPARPAATPVAPAVMHAGMMPTSPVFWGLAAAAVAVAVLAKSKHPPHWVRRLGMR